MNNDYSTPQASINGSRLIRALEGLTVSDVEVSHKHFAMRLGQLIDLSDSISISQVHGRRSAAGFEPSENTSEAVEAEFLQVHSSVVGSIIKSFEKGAGPGRIRFPRPGANAPADSVDGYQPYGKFYAAQQREMDFKIQQLRRHVRAHVARTSPELAQLAALDEVLGDTLAVHSRKFFARIPGLLGRRFDQLLTSYHQPQDKAQDDAGTWLELVEIFGRDMRELLLAEVEARLLPTQGLIEALHSGIEKKTHE
jgi:hypothetical protein